MEQQKQDSLVKEYVQQHLKLYRETGVLSTTLMTHASLTYDRWSRGDSLSHCAIEIEDAREINCSIVKFRALTKVFEGAVWFFGGLQKKVRDCPIQGMSGQGDGFTALLFTMAGRCMITLRDDETKQSITVITADDEKPFGRIEWGSTGMGPMGIQGVDCTEGMGIKLLTQAIKRFPEVHPAEDVFLG